VAAVAPYDLDGDGRRELLWYHPRRRTLRLQRVAGAAITEEAEFGGVPPGATLAGSADFDRDGRADLVWSDGGAGVAILWRMRGLAPRSVTEVALPRSGWSLSAVGDFDGDGDGDWMLEDARTGARRLWWMEDAVQQGGATLPALPPGRWRAACVADLDGDGRDDVVWDADDPGGWAVVWLNGEGAPEVHGYPLPDGMRVLGCARPGRSADPSLVLYDADVGRVDLFRPSGFAPGGSVLSGRVDALGGGIGSPAVLGDVDCRFDLETPGYAAQRAVETVAGARVFTFAGLPDRRRSWATSTATAGASSSGTFPAGASHAGACARGPSTSR